MLYRDSFTVKCYMWDYPIRLWKPEKEINKKVAQAFFLLVVIHKPCYEMYESMTVKCTMLHKGYIGSAFDNANYIALCGHCTCCTPCKPKTCSHLYRQQLCSNVLS